jgi:hypothetical protein
LYEHQTKTKHSILLVLVGIAAAYRLIVLLQPSSKKDRGQMNPRSFFLIKDGHKSGFKTSPRVQGQGGAWCSTAGIHGVED